MSAPAVLFDAPGPRARRRILVATVAVGLAVAALLAVVLHRLADRGQLSHEKWAPLVDPRDEVFEDLWRYLGGGLVNTLRAAAIAIVVSLVLGVVVAMVRWSAPAAVRGPLVVGVEVFRGVPVVLAMYFAARVLPDLGIRLDVLWYVVIGLVVYNSVVFAEIVRAGLAAVPRGQTEAALAIGLTRGQTLRTVLLPQAFRIMLPSLISQLVVVLKDTSLGYIVSYQEFLRRGNLSIQTTHSSLQTYAVIALVFIVVNYSLGRLAQAVHDRSARSREQVAAPDAGVTGAVPAGG